jgi:hypothetical protein
MRAETGLRRLRLPLGRGGATASSPRKRFELFTRKLRPPSPPRRVGPVVDASDAGPSASRSRTDSSAAAGKCPSNYSTPGLRSPAGRWARALRHRTLFGPAAAAARENISNGGDPDARETFAAPAPTRENLPVNSKSAPLRPLLLQCAPCRKVLSSGKCGQAASSINECATKRRAAATEGKSKKAKGKRGKAESA